MVVLWAKVRTLAFIELRKGKSRTVLYKGVTIILVDISLHGYVKSETSEERENAGEELESHQNGPGKS